VVFGCCAILDPDGVVMTSIDGEARPEKRTAGVWGWTVIFLLICWAFVSTVSIQAGTLYLAWIGDLAYLGLLPRVMLVAGLLEPVVAGLPLPVGLFVRGRRPRAVLTTVMWATVVSFVLIAPRAVLPPNASNVPVPVRASLGMLMGLGLRLDLVERDDHDQVLAEWEGTLDDATHQRLRSQGYRLVSDEHEVSGEVSGHTLSMLTGRSAPGLD
jgi:hypothetical protein